MTEQYQPTYDQAELADRAELEHQRDTCTSRDFPVRAWRRTKGKGFVSVRGALVYGPECMPALRAIDTIPVVCSRHAREQGQWYARAVLMVRWEHALHRPFYWFRAAGKCPLCIAQRYAWPEPPEE